MELVNPTFADFLARLAEGAPVPLAQNWTRCPSCWTSRAPLALVRPHGPTLDDLRALAHEHGLRDAELIVAARHYCGKTDLEPAHPGRSGRPAPPPHGAREKQAAAPEPVAAAAPEPRPAARRRA